MCYQRKRHYCEQSEAQRSSKKIQKSPGDANEVLLTREWQQERCLLPSPEALPALLLRREDQTPYKAADPVTAEGASTRPVLSWTNSSWRPLSILFPALRVSQEYTTGENIHQGFHKIILFFWRPSSTALGLCWEFQAHLSSETDQPRSRGFHWKPKTKTRVRPPIRGSSKPPGSRILALKAATRRSRWRINRMTFKGWR